METGRTIVLLNLENLYESLYDALNQVGMFFDVFLFLKSSSNKESECENYDFYSFWLSMQQLWPGA